MSIIVACDHRALFGNARHQGNRPTCIAFASSDLNAACRSPWQPLSAEYAFFHGARRQGTGPNSGVTLPRILEVLKDDGQPIEKAWPYLSVVDASTWVPPVDVGELFFAAGAPAARTPASICAELNNNGPVLLVLTISDAFYLPDEDAVIDSAQPPDSSRVHAVVAVGHGTRGIDSFTLVRNSWGMAWGMAGHAWLSHRYLAPRIVSSSTLKKA